MKIKGRNWIWCVCIGAHGDRSIRQSEADGVKRAKQRKQKEPKYRGGSECWVPKPDASDCDVRDQYRHQSD